MKLILVSVKPIFITKTSGGGGGDGGWGGGVTSYIWHSTDVRAE